MKKVHNFLFFLLAFVTINAISLEIDYNLMNSPDDVVRNETRAIDLLPANDHEKLSDAYACRGESLLLSDNFEGALEDFQKSYDHSLQIHSKHSQLSAIFRALFGQAIIYGCLNRPEMFEQISESLLDIIQLAKCSSHGLHLRRSSPQRNNKREGFQSRILVTL